MQLSWLCMVFRYVSEYPLPFSDNAPILTGVDPRWVAAGITLPYTGAEEIRVYDRDEWSKSELAKHAFEFTLDEFAEHPEYLSFINFKFCSKNGYFNFEISLYKFSNLNAPPYTSSPVSLANHPHKAF